MRHLALIAAIALATPAAADTVWLFDGAGNSAGMVTGGNGNVWTYSDGSGNVGGYIVAPRAPDMEVVPPTGRPLGDVCTICD